MGFILYEKSGTFNPLDHGLSVGDVITVVVVGAGGGGACSVSLSSASASNTLAGETGGSSSFGDILTALGGGGGVKAGSPQSTQGNMMAAPGADHSTTDPKDGYGSAGGGGYWFDGSVRTQRKYGDLDSRNLGGYYVNTGGSNGANDPPYSNNQSPLGVGGPQGKGGKPSGASGGSLCGPGGGGYGAGGGGARFYRERDSSTFIEWWLYGGNSGEVKIVTYKLTSIASIPVTVGIGGAGAKDNEKPDYTVSGGDGADGCVAVFW